MFNYLKYVELLFTVLVKNAVHVVCNPYPAISSSSDYCKGKNINHFTILKTLSKVIANSVNLVSAQVNTVISPQGIFLSEFLGTCLVGTVC